MSTNAYLVLVTIDSEEAAAAMARALLESKLIACANIVPRIRSIYSWEGKIQDDHESLMLIKTTASRMAEIKAEVQRLHSYDTPEVIGFSIDDGLPDYLRWIEHHVLN